ncbi:MAG TPA: ABC transporter permease [Tepidisphaeraceae bacterium]|jgi:ribose/xylose/arabinose/galactoside ABC-type transport system permease subunit
MRQETPGRSSFRLPRLQEAGLIVVIILIGALLTVMGGSVQQGGHSVNNFMRPPNLLGGVVTPMTAYAIMAIGATFVIISGGIDISVGAIFALSALGTAAVLQNFDPDSPWTRTIPTALAISCGIGTLCGLINGIIIVSLRMHPFIVTLGTMSIFRGIGNVAVKIKTLPGPGKVLPDSFTTNFVMYEPRPFLQPVPMIVMLICVILGWLYLSGTVWGRENYAVGGNEEAARLAGLRISWIKLRIYALAGLTAGIAGFVSVGYFGSASTNTGEGYELTVIAAAVVGGASLLGGRGSALGAMLGAMVIKLIENGILVLRLDREYSSIIIGIAIILAVAVDRLSETFRARRGVRIS